MGPGEQEGLELSTPQGEVRATEQKDLLGVSRRKGWRQPRQVMKCTQEIASLLGLPT